jgi:hypothetical protein
MSALIVVFALFYAFIYYAPDELTKVLLALTWTAMWSCSIITLLYYGIKFLIRAFAN